MKICIYDNAGNSTDKILFYKDFSRDLSNYTVNDIYKILNGTYTEDNNTNTSKIINYINSKYETYVAFTLTPDASDSDIFNIENNNKIPVEIMKGYHL